MPHFSIEYSANLDPLVDMKALCRDVLKVALASGVFEIGAVRVRAFRCDAYAVADDKPENGFIDLTLRLAKGRDAATKKRLGDQVFAAMTAFLAPRFETRNFALSFEIREIDPDLSWKKNAIHERLRKA